VCTWGELGAAVCVPSPNSADADTFTVTSVPAYPPLEIVDTIGAGDTFLASTLYGVASGLPLATAADFGCRVAGVKCGQIGYVALDRMKSVWDAHYASLAVRS
jgi:ketohexokinase